MRILFCHENFPDRFGFMASYLAANPEHEVLFASRFQRSGFTLANVRRVILKAGDTRRAPRGHNYAQLWCRTMLAGEPLFDFLRTLDVEFQPHMVLTSASSGITFFAQQAFARAFHVFYAGGISTSVLSGASECGKNAAVAMQSVQVLQSHYCLAFSEEQQNLFPKQLRNTIQVILPWVDTECMNPAMAEGFRCDGFEYVPGQELVSFNLKSLGTLMEHALQKLVLGLLVARPQCRIVLNLGDNPIGKGFESWSRHMPESLRRRLCLTNFMRLGAYRDLLCASTVHICPGTTESLLLGRLEAMSCGTVLMMPVREHAASLSFFKPGENMLEFPETGPEEQLEAVLHALECPHKCAAIRRKGREAVVAAYSPQTLVPAHVAALMAEYQKYIARQRA